MKQSQKTQSALPLVRLILEAMCPVCGAIGPNEPSALFVIVLAEAHAARTGHVVILNGTADMPEAAEEEASQEKPMGWPLPQKWGNA